MVIIVKKGATPAEVRAALAKFNIHPQAEKSPVAATFGLLKDEWRDDGLTYQRKIRQDWD